MNSIVENDLKHIIHLLWNKPNVNMWDFEIYKALTYLFVKLFRDKHYKEKYYSLVQSIEKTETAWQRYLIDLLYETLRSDNGVPAYEKEKLPQCTYCYDIPQLILDIRQHHNAFMSVSGFATDIYDEIIRAKTTEMKRMFWDYCHDNNINDENKINDLYDRFAKQEDILREIYDIKQNKPIHERHYPKDVNYLRKEFNLSQLATYILLIEHREKAYQVEEKADLVRHKSEKKRVNDITEILKVAHKLALSNIFDDFKVFKMYNLSTACELGCVDYEYDSQEWKLEVPVQKNLRDFIADCSIEKCIDYEFIAIIKNKAFKIDIHNINISEDTTSMEQISIQSMEK